MRGNSSWSVCVLLMFFFIPFISVIAFNWHGGTWPLNVLKVLASFACRGECHSSISFQFIFYSVVILSISCSLVPYGIISVKSSIIGVKSPTVASKFSDSLRKLHLHSSCTSSVPTATHPLPRW